MGWVSAWPFWAHATIAKNKTPPILSLSTSTSTSRVPKLLWWLFSPPCLRVFAAPLLSSPLPSAFSNYLTAVRPRRNPPCDYLLRLATSAVHTPRRRVLICKLGRAHITVITAVRVAEQGAKKERAPASRHTGTRSSLIVPWTS